MTKKGHEGKTKSLPKDILQLEHFVLVIRRCQFAWNATKSMLLIWEL